jgi:hypothetical protein
MVFNFRPEADGDDFSPIYTWLIRFSELALFDTMQHTVTTALFEGKWGTGTWNKLKEDEREYQRGAYVDREDAEMYGIPEEGQDEEEEVAEEQEEEDEDEDEGEVESGALRRCAGWALRALLTYTLA